jgi:hypothetical protein
MTTKSYTIPEGYHNGQGTVSHNISSGTVSGSVAVGGTYTATPNKYITSVSVSGPTLSGTAIASDVISGKTFYNTSGTKLTGSYTPPGSLTIATFVVTSDEDYNASSTHNDFYVYSFDGSMELVKYSNSNPNYHDIGGNTARQIKFKKAMKVNILLQCVDSGTEHSV